MSIFKLKTALIGLTSALAFASPLFAASVDGLFDDNQNDFEYYWYYYDDNAGVGKDDRPQMAPTSTPSVINVVSRDSVRHAFGDAADTYKIKAYTFTTGEQSGNKFATMPFTFGEKWKTSWDKTNTSEKSFCGIGSMLQKDGKYIDLTGATSVKFKIKSRVNDLTVRFKIQTFEIDSISNVKGSELKGDEFGYYSTTVTATKGAFADVEVLVSALELPGTWARDIAFNQKRCTKLAWEVEKSANLTTTSDTLDIDNVTIEPYTYVSPSVWTETKPLSPLPEAKGLFSSFDVAPFNFSALKGYWYAYNDAAISGTSSVDTACAYQDEETKLLTLKWADGTGSGDAGQGVMLKYKLGPSVMQGTTEVKGFIGLGCNVYDSAKAKYWDATAAGASSIHFHYATTGDAKFITLEISDINDVADKDAPTRKDTRGSGVVWYKNFPATNGAWVAVELPFNKLVYHDDWAGAINKPLDLTKLAKIQWKIQGAKDLAGIVAVDNIYFPGTSINTVGVKYLPQSKQTSGFNVSYLNGNVNVNWKNTTSFASGKISLVNTKGAVVSSASITKATTSFSTQKLPAGMYFVKLNAVNANGKAVAMQSKVSIVK